MITAQPGEMLVYRDWCDECMSVHYYAHSTTGNHCSLGVSELTANPAYYQAGHHAGIIHYRIRYSAGLHVELPAPQYADRQIAESDWLDINI